ncbi:MAG: hypothetical protein ACRDY7_11975, partial [Acidimicrobiia bacterium]
MKKRAVVVTAVLGLGAAGIAPALATHDAAPRQDAAAGGDLLGGLLGGGLLGGDLLGGGLLGGLLGGGLLGGDLLGGALGGITGDAEGVLGTLTGAAAGDNMQIQPVQAAGLPLVSDLPIGSLVSPVTGLVGGLPLVGPVLGGVLGGGLLGG